MFDFQTWLIWLYTEFYARSKAATLLKNYKKKLKLDPGTMLSKNLVQDTKVKRFSPPTLLFDKMTNYSKDKNLEITKTSLLLSRNQFLSKVLNFRAIYCKLIGDEFARFETNLA